MLITAAKNKINAGKKHKLYLIKHVKHCSFGILLLDGGGMAPASWKGDSRSVAPAVSPAPAWGDRGRSKPRV